MKRTIQIILDEADYYIIANEAQNRLMKKTSFIKFCIASYLNKVRQTHVFAKNLPLPGETKKRPVLSPERSENGYLRGIVESILQEKGVIECQQKKQC